MRLSNKNAPQLGAICCSCTSLLRGFLVGVCGSRSLRFPRPRPGCENKGNSPLALEINVYRTNLLCAFIAQWTRNFSDVLVRSSGPGPTGTWCALILIMHKSHPGKPAQVNSPGQIGHGPEVEATSPFRCDVPRSFKARWVAAANRSGTNLFDWVAERLNKAAKEELGE